MSKLRCLSLQQPWAELVAAGRKLVENRTWETQVRGLLGIHASRSTRTVRGCTPAELADWLPRWPQQKYHLGCVVAVVELIACVRPRHLPPDLLGHEFATTNPSRWCFVLRNPVRLLKPVSATGNARFFYVDLPDDSLPPRLRARLLAANTQG